MKTSCKGQPGPPKLYSVVLVFVCIALCYREVVDSHIVTLLLLSDHPASHISGRMNKPSFNLINVVLQPLCCTLSSFPTSVAVGDLKPESIVQVQLHQH